MKFKKGFTLAEVLMALTVVGVVAHMTIPAILNSANNKENVALLNKNYSIMSSAFKMYTTTNGCSGDIRVCSGGLSTDEDLWNIFKPSFNVLKDCGTAAGKGCAPIGVTYKYVNSNLSWQVLDNDTSRYKVQLADGEVLAINMSSANCSGNASRSGVVEPLVHNCGGYYLDVNGAKGPNQVGRDLFHFFITASGVYPKGIADDMSYTDANGMVGCDPSSSNISVSPREGTGFGCAAKVLREGAINY